MRLKQTTDSLLIADRAEVAIVYPICGGYGAAHPESNLARIEVLPEHLDQRLPEVVRFVWLVAQLQSDLPVFNERLPADRWQRLAALAMVPPVLEAAEYVAQTYRNGISIQAALSCWQLVANKTDAMQTAAVLTDWWQTYFDQPPHWSVALSALDRMLVAAGLTS